jgi:methionyl-tRNA formyltransferase
MRIAFMGTPDFAVPSLESLLQSEETVVGVVTQPDRPKGRGQSVVASPVKRLCQRAGLPVLQPLKMKDPAFLEALQNWKPELIAVAAFGRILPPVILELPPQGCINVHASLLPKYRGAAPIQWALINGERETGVTTMLMDAGMDTGPILLQERVAIQPEETAGGLSTRLAVVGGRLLLATIQELKAGTVTPKPQDHTQATSAPLLKKEDGLIDWALGASAIANRIRGLTPWPGAYTFMGQDRWLIWRALPTHRSAQGHRPGAIVEVSKAAVLVATGTDLLAVTEIQPANSRRMTVAQYLAGHPVQVGTVLASPPSDAVPGASANG